MKRKRQKLNWRFVVLLLSLILLLSIPLSKILVKVVNIFLYALLIISSKTCIPII